MADSDNQKIAELTVQQRAEVDRSVRLPVIFFFTSSLAWLLLASLLGLLASLKLHLPDLWADCPYVNYGRVFPAFTNSFIYGWAFQAGLGALLWMMARLCRVPVKNVLTLILAGKFWNIGVTLGVLGILFGKGSSIEWLDFPAFVWPLLLAAYTAIAVWLIVLFKARRDGHVFISQWYLLGACFWFPWIFLTANLLIRVWPSAAVMGPAINSWYVNGLLLLWFVPIGIGAAYYLIPKIVGRPIASYQLALGSFALFALIAPWSGMQKYMGGPIPAWMPSVSGAASILLLIPMLAIAVNLHKTVKGHHSIAGYSPTLRFVMFGAIAFNVFMVVGAALSLFSIGRFGQFSFAQSGFQMLGLYAFFSMTMFGAMYYIMPRLVRCEWLSGKWINLHFLLAAYGVLFMGICLVIGGLSQGREMDTLDNEFSVSVIVIRGYLVGLSLAWLGLFVSHVIFCFHMIGIILRLGSPSGEPTYMGSKHQSPAHS